MEVVLGLGSNYGERRKNIISIISWLEGILLNMKKSRIYETPCALKSGRPYMNAVVLGDYTGTIVDLNQILKEKEIEFGRDDEGRSRGDVPIDIDIVIANGDIIKEWDYRQKFFQIGYQEIN